MTFLEEVVDGVRDSIQNGYYDQRPTQAIPFEKASLKAALRESFSIIAEIKPASPTAGALYSGDVGALATTYSDAGARAISVLCEQTRFGGKLENLHKAKKTGLPVLAKDFVVSEKQLQAYAAHGADAALLIFELFQRRKTEVGLETAIRRAHENGLEVLLEVHSADALQKALKTDADVVGINNRDLDDLSLNVLHFQNVLSDAYLEAGTIEKPIIAESGFQSPHDVQMAKLADLRGVLIGTGILKTNDPQATLKELTRI